MKLENCKVGMVVKVKSLEKCKKLGFKDYFDSNFCDKEVEIKSVKNGSFNGVLMDYCDVQLKTKLSIQGMPIQFLKKIKSAD